MQLAALTSLVLVSTLSLQGGNATIDLFAKEAWYKNTKGEVQEFVGVLRKTERGGNVIGFGRNNPFRLEMDGNKVREVYVGGNLKLLDPYVGKKIKLVGKAVDMEVEGRQHREIWAASLVVLGGDAQKAGIPKIIARVGTRVAPGNATVINSAEQLGVLRNVPADKASADVAKMLKVDKIDWEKQMLIIISGGTQRTGGYSVEATSLEVKSGNLIVHWKLNSPPPGSFVTQALTNPAQTILVERFAGEVSFDPPAPPAGKKIGKKLGQ